MFTCNPSGCRRLRAEPPQPAAPLVPRQGIAVNLPNGLWHCVQRWVFAFVMAGLYRGTPIPMVPIWRGVRSLHHSKACDAEGFPVPWGDEATTQRSHGTKAKTRSGISAEPCANCSWEPAAGLELCPPGGHPQPSDGTACGQGDGTLSLHGLVSSVGVTTSFFITDKYIKPWSRAVGCPAVNLTSG